jgi:hypothetical protein
MVFVLCMATRPGFADESQYSITMFDNPPSAVALTKWADMGLFLVTILPIVGDDGTTSYMAYFKRELPSCSQPIKQTGNDSHIK